MSIQTIDFQKAGFEAKVRVLRDRLRGGCLVADGTGGGIDVQKAVREAIEGVRRGGDSAVVSQTLRLHGCKLSAAALAVPKEDIDRAWGDRKKNDPGFIRLIAKVAANIRAYQKRILVKAPPALRRGGRTLGLRYTPIDRVAVYVPGGKAAYPSSVLMTVVPAQVAGVRQIVIVSPPNDRGAVSDDVLVVARFLGIETIYRVAGAAGLAAVAFGTKTIPAVDKIVGPGSAFIAEAKRQLFGAVGIDSVAGPSEVLIVADASAQSEPLAADMLAQAEHNPGSAVLVTPSRKLANAVAEALEAQLADAGMTRAAETRACLEAYSGIIITPSLAAACEVANDFATEHLRIVTADDEAALKRIRHAGAIFLGPYSPVPLGDYYAGPSHVLPTGGTARFFGPLSCNDFLKASSLVRYDRASLSADAKDVADFARREGLTAHAAAVKQAADARK
ncbi:MAG: histidinol dehydrogenase [Phycisphaerae bacterium]|jgi:histidinol dehydrogenase